MTKHVATHVSKKQKKQWKQEADSMGASMSEYVKMMTEAGRKKFEREVSPDETRAELREQRNDFGDALRDARSRINTLERQLSATERQEIIEYVEENPGAEHGDIIQHLVNSVNGRANKLMAELEGAELRVDSKGRYYAGDYD